MRAMAPPEQIKSDPIKLVGVPGVWGKLLVMLGAPGRDGMEATWLFVVLENMGTGSQWAVQPE